MLFHWLHVLKYSFLVSFLFILTLPSVFRRIWLGCYCFFIRRHDIFQSSFSFSSTLFFLSSTFCAFTKKFLFFIQCSVSSVLFFFFIWQKSKQFSLRSWALNWIYRSFRSAHLIQCARRDGHRVFLCWRRTLQNKLMDSKKIAHFCYVYFSIPASSFRLATLKLFFLFIALKLVSLYTNHTPN